MTTTISDCWQEIRYVYSNAPLAIQVAMIFIAIAVFSTVMAYLTILRSRYKAYMKRKRLNKLLPRIDELLIDEVMTNPDIPHDVDPAKVQLNLAPFEALPLHKRWARETLTARIIHFRQNVKGNMGVLLRNLYTQLDLDKDAYRKLKSRKWNRKVAALVEFTSMDLSISDVTILPLANSRNRELRAAARQAYIKISKNEPFKFFDSVTDPLLPWDQVELFRIITTTEDIAIPNFARWITYSSNKSVVSFCMKLVVHYNQLPAVPAIIKLLDNRDHYTRADAIECLGRLKVEEVEDKLVQLYTSQPLFCQIEILRALGRISSGKHIDFLRNEFLHATDFDLKKAAARAIVKNEWIAREVLDELLATTTGQNLLILKHCMNPLIKY
ncbi:HEAT repeat domain-containing protein [Chitinophaga sp. Cy-1792]|uniref:HEAT repeat domain-containing protein n=1 Tax=Chitinophaga sp. Cy-1792 TaxID=2608339 RepID=UPI00141DB37C|nr:HEAT repeat domain-containing protein [Chitinophaga sp. Cy-1792]NIG54218.1 HEAT repeat domain-containing protein [Chitinophaga sp. Cy-1792]